MQYFSFDKSFYDINNSKTCELSYVIPQCSKARELTVHSHINLGENKEKEIEDITRWQNNILRTSAFFLLYRLKDVDK